MDLTHLSQLARAATPNHEWRPWRWSTSNSYRRMEGIIEPAYHARDGQPDISISDEDMAFIAAASPQVIIALVERLQRVEKVAAIMHDALVETRDEYDHKEAGNV